MRLRPILVLAAAAATAVVLACLPAVAAAGTYVEPFTVITGPGNQGEPAIDNSVVLWVDDSSGSTAIDQRYLPSSGDPTGPITTFSQSSDASRHHPDYSAGLGVWWDGRYGDGDIWAYSVLTGHEFPIYTGPGEQVEPSISDGYVVWQDDRNGGWDIYGAEVDAATDAVKSVFPICTVAGSQTHPVVYGNTVVWQDYRNGTWDIYGARIAPTTHAITEFPVAVQPRSQTWPSTDGTTVVWQDFRNGGWDIYGATLGVGLTPSVTPFAEPICAAYAAQTHAQVAQEFVLWQDRRDTQAGASYGTDIWARDMSRETEFPIVVAKGDQVSPSLSFNKVVWEDERAGNSDVYGAIVTPWSISVRVGNGSGWTKTRNLTVSMLDVTTDVNPPVAKMLVFNEGDQSFDWRPFGPTYDMLLPAGDGQKKLGIRFTDSSDQTSPLVSETVTLDMTPPVTRAPYAVAVAKGATAKIPYRVNDALSPRATVTIRIKTLGGTTVKTLSLGRHVTGKLLTARFVCNLAKKKYRFEVYAKDLAGNQQKLPVGANHLTVK